MKDLVNNILNEYLTLYPGENERQEQFKEFLIKSDDKQIRDWNNFDGHIVTGGLIYAKKENKFLMVYHKDLKMYLYPGGHIDENDNDFLDAALREASEETGLSGFKVLSITENKMVPLDIDTQLIGYNERLDLPSHYHYDFRYLFMIPEIKAIAVDTSELGEYKWVDYDEFINMARYAIIKDKIIEAMRGNV